MCDRVLNSPSNYDSDDVRADVRLRMFASSHNTDMLARMNEPIGSSLSLSKKTSYRLDL